MTQAFAIKTLSKINFLGRFFGYSIFKYPENSFKISILGVVGLMVNFLHAVYRVYTAVNYIGIFISAEYPKNTKTFYILIMIQLLSINTSNMIVMVFNALFSKNIFKTFNMIEKIDHEV
jgi:hypothetical protein